MEKVTTHVPKMYWKATGIGTLLSFMTAMMFVIGVVAIERSATRSPSPRI